MKQESISRQELSRWLESLLPDHTVIAPVSRGGRDFFAVVASAGEVNWDAGRTANPAKQFFFPASEAIVRWRMGPDGLQVETPLVDRPQVLFGARPCDGKALDVLDRLLLADPVDVYYQARRQQTTVVGYACDQRFEGCFCETLGGGPADARYLDVMLTRRGDGYAIDAVTEKGRQLLAGARTEPVEVPAVTPADGPALQLAPPEVWRSQFEAPFWADLAQRCLGCRTCTYDCPVCYCFDVRDRTLSDGTIERLRCWDSCQGSQCFAIAGGHNPRPTQAARQRQRYMHKFLYYPEREGVTLCVGCGRCVVDCPANIDIREVIAAVAASADEAPADRVR
jgi:sulfhydrogenase subunit beta (sulfur reductase)